MQPRHALFVALRVIGVVFAVRAIIQTPTIITLLDNGGSGAFSSSIVFGWLLMGGAGCALWFGAGGLSQGAPQAAEGSTLSISSVQLFGIALAVLGVYLAAGGAVRIVGDIATRAPVFLREGLPFGATNRGAAIASDAMQIGIGLVLALASASFASRMQPPHTEPEPDAPGV